MSLSDKIKEVIYTKNLTEELGYVEDPTVILSENQSAIMLDR